MPAQAKRLSFEEKKKLLDRVTKDGLAVSRACREAGVSRDTFYRIYRRWLGNGKVLEPSLSQTFSRGAKKRITHDHVSKVKKIFSKFPNASKYAIAEKLSRTYPDFKLSPSGVYCVLKGLNMNLASSRLAWATRSYPNQIYSADYTVNKFDFILFTRTFIIVSLFVGASVYSGTWWIDFISSITAAHALGIVFASIALICGTFFLLYSMKYYITLAVVLSFSQSSVNSDQSAVNGRKKGLLSWILGNLRPESKAKSFAAGLTPDLSHITLEKYPFISVHIPFYNEKKVVERSIQAAVNFDYKGDYEVILCDDSTDETTQIIANYLKSQAPNIKSQTGDDWKLTQGEVRPGVVVKHIHRSSRAGFKGGALELARKLTDPRAEFVSVFDADFVPYPDTLTLFLKYFKASTDTKVAAVQGYQWHVLNKSENWITRGVRTEYAGSYVIERSGEEIYQGLKQIAGSVYCIRADILRAFGWGTSITEDFELTLRLYEAGYKIAFTPYIQAPAEAVSTVRRLIRQRMRWAEGASFNVKVMLSRMLFGKWEVRSENMDNEVGNETEPSNLSPQNPASHLQPLTSRQWVPSRLTPAEKLEFAYLAPYYLQAAFLVVGTLSWFLSEAVFHTRLPFWTAAFGWSLVFTNLLSLPLMNVIGLFLEESDERDYVGILSFIALSYIVVPFQAYAAIKGFLESREGPWFRTPKTGAITDIVERSRFGKLFGQLFGRPALVSVHSSQLIVDSGTISLNGEPLTVSPALALASAESNLASAYNNFSNGLSLVVGRSVGNVSRRAPRLVKVLIVVLLIGAMTINYFAINTPVTFAFGSDVTYSSDNLTVNATRTGGAAGTSGNATLTVTSTSGFAAGNLVLVIQMISSGADCSGISSGDFEERVISTVDSGTQVTLTATKTNGYSSTGTCRAQMIKAEMNKAVTVNSGVTISTGSWNGTTGGVLYYIADSFTVNLTGIVDVNGDGFSGGGGGNLGAGDASAGGSASDGSAGSAGSGNGAGGGGSITTAAGGGQSATNNTVFRGGGGGGGDGDDKNGGCGRAGAAGGAGGGIVYIHANTITNSGTIRSAGSVGSDSSAATDGVSGGTTNGGGGGGGRGASGGGGSGGSIWLVASAEITAAGTLTASGGSGGTAGAGGAGGTCGTTGTGDGGGGGGGGSVNSSGGSTDCTSAGSNVTGSGTVGSTGGDGRIKCDDATTNCAGETANPAIGHWEAGTVPVPEYVIFAAPAAYFLPKLARRIKKLTIFRKIKQMIASI